MLAPVSASTLRSGMLILLAPLCLAVSAGAQMTPLGNVHIFWGSPSDLALQHSGGNSYVYVVLDESDTPVAQFDVTNPASPVYVGHLDAPGWTVAVELLENRLYVPGAGGEVAIFDVSDPLHIVRIGTILNGLGTRLVEIALRRIDFNTVHAYLDAHDDALDIWDVTNAASPFRVARIPHSGRGGSMSFHTSGRYLYDSSDSLRVYQVFPLDSIRQVDVQVTGNPDPRDFAVHPSGDVGYLASEKGVFIYDLSEPTAPSLVKEFIPHDGAPDPIPEMKGNYVGVAVSNDGQHLYLAGRLGYEPWSEGGDYPIDEPLPMGYEVIFYAPYWGKVRAGRVRGQATTLKGGLQVLDIADPLNPVQSGQWVDNQKQTYMLRAFADGDTVYVADWVYGFEMFDVSESSDPELLGGYHCSGHTVGVHVVGSYAYVVQNNGGSLIVVDISNRSNPQIVSTYDTGLHMWSAWSDGSRYLYLTGNPFTWPSYPTSGQRLHVIDISNPLSPVRANVCIPESDLKGVREGKYVYSAQGAIYDLTEPQHPIVVGSMSRAEGSVSGLLDKVGGYAYMYEPASPDGYLRVVDVSDIYRDAPVVVGSAQMPSKWGKSVVFDRRPGRKRVYVALDELGIGVVDVSDPQVPQYLGCITHDALSHPLDPVKDIFCQGDRLWTTTYGWSGSLSEYDMSQGIENLQLVQSVPNIDYTWRTEFVDGYAYRVAINGLDIIQVPSSLVPDHTSPSPVESFAAVWQHDRVLLAWTDPSESDFVATKVMRRTDRFPLSIVDGDQVYDGKGGSFSDMRITSGTAYFYSAFAYDIYQNYASLGETSRDSAYVPDPYPPGLVDYFRVVGLNGQAWIRWVNPPDADYAGTRVVRRTDRYPETPDDGTTVFEGAGTEAMDVGPVNGQTCYYSAFAYDTYRNFGAVGEGGRDFAVPAPVLFRDDFETEILGSLPSLWDVRNSEDTLEACHVWSDALLPFFGTEHSLRSRAMGGYSCGSIYDPPGQYGWFIRDLAPVDSFTIYFDMLDPANGGVGEGAYLWYGYEDHDNWICLHLCPNYCRMVHLQQMVDWVSYDDWFNPCLRDGPGADWSSVRVNVTPSSLALYVDGAFRLSVENDTVTYVINERVEKKPWKTHYVAPPGLVALGASGGVYFDNVVVTAGGGPTAVDDRPASIGPSAYRLHHSYPNPFNPTCTIRYEIPRAGKVILRVFIASGSLVRTLVDAWREPGVHSAVWDGKDDGGSRVSSGVYFCRFEAGNSVATHKLVLLR